VEQDLAEFLAENSVTYVSVVRPLDWR
jgi:hypothetical protein